MESLSRQEMASWLEEARITHDWVAWCKSKKGADKIRSLELSGNEFLFYYDHDETKSKTKRTKRT